MAHYEDAWEILDRCSRTIVPTASHVYSYSAYGGCPEAFDSSATYETGDEVSHNGLALSCKAFPLTVWCSVAGHEPYGEHADAWNVLGTCNVIIAPASSPVHLFIPLLPLVDALKLMIVQLHTDLETKYQ